MPTQILLPMIDSSDIRRLLDSGCISPKQADQIKKLYGLASYPPREETSTPVQQKTNVQPQAVDHPKLIAVSPKPISPAPATPRPDSPFLLFIKRNYLAVILSVLGAFLIIGGLSTLVVANWQNTPRWVKMLEAIVLMGGFWAGGFYLKEIQGKFVRTGIALYVIGMCMWGICLRLYSFLYDVSSSPAQGLLLFTAGIAAFPWILRVKALFAIFMVSVLLWGASSMNDPAAPWAFQTLVPLIGLCFWGLGVFLPFIAKGYYALYARTSKLTGLGVFLFSLLYTRVQNWGEISFLSDFLPLGIIGAACILWDCSESPAPISPEKEAATPWNRKTFIYGAASLLSLAAMAWIPPSLSWIAIVLLSGAAFFLSRRSSRTENITLLVFLTLLCLLPPSPSGEDGSSFFFHGILVAPLVLAFSLILRDPGNFTKGAIWVNNIGIGFYMALAGYTVCDPPILPNGFIHVAQMITPWVFAITLFIRERDRGSLIQSVVMLCVTFAAILGSRDAGFWVCAVLLIYLFMRVERNRISSLLFASWLYICLTLSYEHHVYGIALPVLLLAFIKRGLPSPHNNTAAHNASSLAIPLIEGGLLLYGIFMIDHSLVRGLSDVGEWVTALTMTLIPLCLWGIEKRKEQDWSLPSLVRNIAFLLIMPAILLNLQIMFILCLFFWAFLSITRKATLIASLTESPAPSKQPLILSQNAIFQTFGMLLSLVLLTMLSACISYEFLPQYVPTWRLFFWTPVLPAIYTAAVIIYHSNNQTARRFCGTIALLIPAFSVLIVSLLPTGDHQNTPSLYLFSILPWILGFGILSTKFSLKVLIPGMAALLIMTTGLFLPGWPLLVLLCFLLLISFLGYSKHPAPFLIHGFGLLIVTVCTNILDQFLTPAIPLALLAASLLLDSAPSWEFKLKRHLSTFAVLALCLLTSSHLDVINTHPSASAISICAALSLACLIRLSLNIRKRVYPFPLFAIIDTSILIALVGCVVWENTFATTFLMLAYGLFRVVTWSRFSFLSPLSSLITGGLFSFAVFISFLSPLNASNPIFGCFLYIALLTTMVTSKLGDKTDNLIWKSNATSIGHIGQALALALFLPLSSFYNELKNTETSVIWLISILLIPAWLVLSTAISKRKFLPEIVLLCLPAFLFIEDVPSTAQLAIFALCGFIYLISGYRMEIGTSLKKYRFETILGLSVFALLPMGITSNHGVSYNPFPYLLLYLPILLMTAALYAKPFQTHPAVLLQKTGLIALIILSQVYCYRNNSTNIDWLTLPFFALPGVLMIIPLLANRKALGMPMILLMVAASICVPIICPNFSIGYVIASLILMGASFLALGMKSCSATYVTGGIIMMSLVSFSIVFRVFDSRVERGLSLLICGVAFLVLAFIAERTRHFLLKQIANQSTTTPS